jgi:hypothetical protein
MSFAIRASVPRSNPINIRSYKDLTEKNNASIDRSGKYVDYELVIAKKELLPTGISLIDLSDNATLILPNPEFNCTEKEISLLNRNIVVVVKCKDGKIFVLNHDNIYLKLHFDKSWSKLNIE